MHQSNIIHAKELRTEKCEYSLNSYFIAFQYTGRGSRLFISMLICYICVRDCAFSVLIISKGYLPAITKCFMLTNYPLSTDSAHSFSSVIGKDGMGGEGKKESLRWSLKRHRHRSGRRHRNGSLIRRYVGCNISPSPKLSSRAVEATIVRL